MEHIASRLASLGTAIAIAALTAATGCGADDEGDTSGDTGGAAATGGAATGGAATGGAATGGAATGGAATGGAATGGAATGGDTFWGGPYAPPATEADSHNEDEDCLACHDGTSGAPEFAFAGTVSAPDVEVAVRQGSTLLSAYSAGDGTFYVLATDGTVTDWTAAEIRMRTAAGESTMMGDGEPGCNSCHTGGDALAAP